jgi:hypothetical protein
VPTHTWPLLEDGHLRRDRADYRHTIRQLMAQANVLHRGMVQSAHSCLDVGLGMGHFRRVGGP